MTLKKRHRVAAERATQRKEKVMKRLISTALALAVLGGATAASAAPGYDWRGPVSHREVVRFAPAPHHWVRGERFMPGYGRYMVVDNYRAYHLRPAPFGFHWVRVGADFLMISNRSGRIAEAIYGGY
jgi:Ni/Co efflux regulator RcnB